MHMLLKTTMDILVLHVIYQLYISLWLIEMHQQLHFLANQGYTTHFFNKVSTANIYFPLHWFFIYSVSTFGNMYDLPWINVNCFQCILIKFCASLIHVTSSLCVLREIMSVELPQNNPEWYGHDRSIAMNYLVVYIYCSGENSNVLSLGTKW